MTDTVKFRYSASSNASFYGEIDTNITREKWNTMSEQERVDVLTEELFNLVDISEV